MMRKAAAVCVAAALLGSMGACSEPLPTVQSETTATPAVTVQLPVTEDQEKQIRARILDVVNSATENKDASQLSSRVSGPELDIRTSEIAVYAFTGNADDAIELPSEASQINLPITTSWPRSIFTITTTTSDQQSQRLLVMTQDSAHSDYKLWGVCPLFQNVQMPAFSVDGNLLGGADDTGFVLAPKDALTQYADVLQNGDSSASSSLFEDDQLRQNISSVSSKIQQTFDDTGVQFSQTEEFTADDSQIQVMHTADGGELVVGRIDSVWTRSLDQNRQALPASDAEKALFGATEATNSIKVTYVNTVALYVPAADSGQQIRAVGAQRQPVKAEAV